MHDGEALREALKLAEVRRGFCAPNPAVGALVVKEGEVISRGFHWACGQPHAEVNALRNVGEQAKGATLYVTLEPCCHWGRTPPCTELIKERGIKRVVYGYRDPNPQVQGGGERQLREAGISCELHSLEILDKFYESYLHWTTTKRPFVTAKLAMTLDGKIAKASGQPMEISGSELNHYTHEQRRRADAILTTAATVRADDPKLDVRLGDQVYKKPIYILDSSLSLPETLNIYDTAERITIFYRHGASNSHLTQLRDRSIRCIDVAHFPGGLSLEAVLNQIGEDGIHDLWVEAGGKLLQSFCDERLLQRTLLYVSPKWVGDAGKAAFEAEKTPGFEKARRIEWHPVGQEIMCDIHW